MQKLDVANLPLPLVHRDLEIKLEYAPIVDPLVELHEAMAGAPQDITLTLDEGDPRLDLVGKGFFIDKGLSEGELCFEIQWTEGPVVRWLCWVCGD